MSESHMESIENHATDDEIIALLKEGKSYTAIQLLTGCSRMRISRIKHRHQLMEPKLDPHIADVLIAQCEALRPHTQNATVQRKWNELIAFIELTFQQN